MATLMGLFRFVRHQLNFKDKKSISDSLNQLFGGCKREKGTKLVVLWPFPSV